MTNRFAASVLWPILSLVLLMQCWLGESLRYGQA